MSKTCLLHNNAIKLFFINTKPWTLCRLCKPIWSLSTLCFCMHSKENHKSCTISSSYSLKWHSIWQMMTYSHDLNKYKRLNKDILQLNYRAWVGNLKQQVPITSKSSNFKDETQCYGVKLPKSAGTRQYCPKILQVPGTHGTRTNSSPAKSLHTFITLCLL